MKKVTVKPQSVQEVVTCLAREGSVSVVGGDHSGYAKSGDLVLDMSHFSSVTVEGEGLSIGAGVTLKQVAMTAAEHGLAVPLGTAPSVGMGLVLQGGVGHLTRARGLALDAVKSLQLVTAQGQVLEVSEHAEPELSELFWACRGCAPNFGVVTKVTLETAPFQQMLSVRQVFDAEEALLQKYMSWSSELPVDCSADCCLYFSDPTVFPKSHLLMGVYSFDLASRVPRVQFSEEAVWSICREGQGPEELMAHEPYLSEQPEGTVHPGFLSKRGFYVRALFLPKCDLSAEILACMKRAPSQHCYFHFQHMGGAVREKQDSAFLARNAEWSLVISGVWDTADASGGQACKEWVLQVIEELLPKALGSYATDLGPDDEVLAQHSFGPKTQRLLELKKKWDPQNRFRHGFPLLALGRST